MSTQKTATNIVDSLLGIMKRHGVEMLDFKKDQNEMVKELKEKTKEFLAPKPKKLTAAQRRKQGKTKDLENIKKWFDKHPYINKVILGYLGTFCKYELSGEESEGDFSYVVDEMFHNYNWHKTVKESNYYNRNHEEYSFEKVEAAFKEFDRSPYSFNIYNFLPVPKRGFKAVVVERTANNKLRCRTVTADVE